jgi:predicted DNA-binding transcriptional regulator AlpA
LTEFLNPNLIEGRTEMEKQYYKPEEVMKLLNKSRSTFYREVEDGSIPSELEEGRKRGRKFPKEAIDAHAKLLKPKNKTKLTFGPTTNSGLWASYQNHLKIYEVEDIVTYDKLLEWREVNYDIFMEAREGNKRVGGVTFLPLAEDIIQSLIDGKMREQNIPLSAIRKWSDEELTVYVPSISITHTENRQKDKERGHFVIKNAIRWAFSLDRQYDIRKWYAIATTPEGEKLVKHLGFSKIEGKRNAYLLTDIRNATKPIRSFIEMLEQEEDPLVPSQRDNRQHNPK